MDSAEKKYITCFERETIVRLKVDDSRGGGGARGIGRDIVADNCGWSSGVAMLWVP